MARILGIPSVCVCSMNVGNTLNAMNPLIHEALAHDEASREANVLIKERYGVDVMEESEFYFHYSKNFNLVTTAKPINPPFARHHALKVRASTRKSTCVCVCVCMSPLLAESSEKGGRIREITPVNERYAPLIRTREHRRRLG